VVVGFSFYGHRGLYPRHYYGRGGYYGHGPYGGWGHGHTRYR
jgi:hypothetical protein